LVTALLHLVMLMRLEICCWANKTHTIWAKRSKLISNQMLITVSSILISLSARRKMTSN